jgi:TPP-dependent pyruvate/acetoin dehydrogenase alpha subunit
VRSEAGSKAASEGPAAEYQEDLLLDLYREMLLIRRFEERAAREFMAAKIPGVVHLYAGEEACAVGVCAHLRETDVITSTHRGHGHCLAKGADVKRMVAELLGRSTGVCRGKGGSMHIAEVEKGILGANGIVGAGLPLACGAALAAQYRDVDDVAVSFFGDGAANIGSFNEALNLAAIWKLPVVFVAENNGYAEATPFEYHCAVANVADRAAGYDMPGQTIDGSDVLAVYAAAEVAIARARSGSGPSLLEVRTARLAGHYEGDTQTYREDGEGEELVERDPLVHLRKRIEMLSADAAPDLGAIEHAIAQTLDEAWAFAEASPFPAPEEALVDAYATYGAPQ